MVCGVLDAFEEKWAVPRRSQCCHAIPHRVGMSKDKEPCTAKKIQEGLCVLPKPLFFSSIITPSWPQIALNLAKNPYFLISGLAPLG